MAQIPISLSSRIRMVNGLGMPQVHLGVYETSGKETFNAVSWALEAGYRAIDSAQMYNNERETGDAIKTFLASKENTTGLSRQDIFFTSKLASNSSYENARKSITQSVKQSGLDYIDLFLLHSPYGGKSLRLESWKAVEDAIEAGEVKTGGVSNFGVKHVKELLSSKPRIRPVVNQIEVHPFNTRTELTAFCRDNDMVVQAYAPLAKALRMKDPTIVSLSQKYSCTAAQLMIRWSLQHGYVPLPKSVTKTRIIANINIEGFEISKEDMSKMDGLDEGLVTDWDPLDAD